MGGRGAEGEAGEIAGRENEIRRRNGMEWAWAWTVSVDGWMGWSKEVTGGDRRAGFSPAVWARRQRCLSFFSIFCRRTDWIVF